MSPIRRSGKKEARASSCPGRRAWEEEGYYLDAFAAPSARASYEQPVVAPQVSHFRQVPLRTRVKLAQLGQGSPS
jgi:hypothetical protein